MENGARNYLMCRPRLATPHCIALRLTARGGWVRRACEEVEDEKSVEYGSCISVISKLVKLDELQIRTHLDPVLNL